MATLIRLMTTQDLPEVRSLCSEMGYEVSAEDIASRFKFILERPDHALLVAVVEERVTAWAHVSLTPALSDRERAEINGLVVGKKARKQGVGRTLNAACEAWAREKRCQVIRVRSQAMREGAHEFCVSLGYELRKIQNVFTKELSTASR